MNLDLETMPVFNALNNRVQNLTNKLVQNGADMKKIKVLETDVSNIQDKIPTFENLLKQKTDPLQIVDRLTEQMHKVIKDIEPINDRNENKDVRNRIES